MDDGHCRLTRRVHNLMDHIFDHEIGTQYVVGGKGSVYRLLEVIFVHVEADLGEEALASGGPVHDDLTVEEVMDGCDMHHMQDFVVRRLNQPGYPYLTRCIGLYQSLYASTRRVVLGLNILAASSFSCWEDEVDDVDEH